MIFANVDAHANAGFNIILGETEREIGSGKSRGRQREREEERGRNELVKRHSFNRVRGYKWVLISPELEHRSREFRMECI